MAKLSTIDGLPVSWWCHQQNKEIDVRIEESRQAIADAMRAAKARDDSVRQQLRMMREREQHRRQSRIHKT